MSFLIPFHIQNVFSHSLWVLQADVLIPAVAAVGGEVSFSL